jgi:TatD family-associated radical SAM protein
VGGGLYINLTNRCTNDCVFCVRGQPGLPLGTDLWLDREPEPEEIIERLSAAGPCEEVVFCGYGEPTLRLQALIDTARAVKALLPGTPVRLNTNGHGSLIAGQDITPRLAGLLDRVSISLNAHNAGEYTRLCRPVHGEPAFAAVLAFAEAAKEHIPSVTLTVLRGFGDIERCREAADALGLPLKVREKMN